MRMIAALAGTLALLAGLGSGTSEAGQKKLVEGTVYDTTCVTVCRPECPPPPRCGPGPERGRNAICAQASIVCPLYRIAPGTPVYAGEGSLMNVRERGSTTVLARLPIVEGSFEVRLEPGEYIFHPYLAEERCWSAAPVVTRVTARSRSPVRVAISATDRCVTHAD